MAEEQRHLLRGTISLGNLLTIAGGIIVAGIGWGQFEASQKSFDDALKATRAELERRIVELESDKRTRVDRDLQTVRVLTEMQADIRYMRQAFDRLEKSEMAR